MHEPETSPVVGWVRSYQPVPQSTTRKPPSRAAKICLAQVQAPSPFLLEALQTALGDLLPPHARARLLRMLDRLELVCAQISELERERDAVLEAEAPDKAEGMIQQLAGLLLIHESLPVYGP